MNDNNTETKSAFSARIGVSKPRISQLVARGLPVNPDGRINIREGLTWLDKNLDPTQRVAQGKAKTGLSAVGAVGGDEPEDLTEAKRRHEIVKTQRSETALAKERGEVVDKEEIGRAVFSFARAHRDAWIAWSARTAPLLAAELGVDGRGVAIALDRAVTEHLQDLADLPVPEGLADG